MANYLNEVIGQKKGKNQVDWKNGTYWVGWFGEKKMILNFWHFEIQVIPKSSN